MRKMVKMIDVVENERLCEVIYYYVKLCVVKNNHFVTTVILIMKNACDWSDGYIRLPNEKE